MPLRAFAGRLSAQNSNSRFEFITGIREAVNEQVASNASWSTYCSPQALHARLWTIDWVCVCPWNFGPGVKPHMFVYKRVWGDFFKLLQIRKMSEMSLASLSLKYLSLMSLLKESIFDVFEVSPSLRTASVFDGSCFKLFYSSLDSLVIDE